MNRSTLSAFIAPDPPNKNQLQPIRNNVYLYFKTFSGYTDPRETLDSKKNANQLSKLKSEIGIIVGSIRRETIDKRKIKEKLKLSEKILKNTMKGR